MVIKPLGKMILIEPIHEVSKFSSDDNSLTSKVKVVAVGPNVTEVAVDDIIVANYWGTDMIEVDDKTLYFVKESDDYILAKVYDTLPE